MTATTLYFTPSPPTWSASSAQARKAVPGVIPVPIQVPTGDAQLPWLKARGAVPAEFAPSIDKATLAALLNQMEARPDVASVGVAVATPTPVPTPSRGPVPLPTPAPIPIDPAQPAWCGLADQVLALAPDDLSRILAVAQGRYFQMVNVDGFGAFEENVRNAPPGQVDLYLDGLGLPRQP